MENQMQTLIKDVQSICPNIGHILGFATDTYIMLQVFFRYDKETIIKEESEEEWEEDIETEQHSMYDPRYKHMFLHQIILQNGEFDMKLEKTALIDSYNKLMTKR